MLRPLSWAAMFVGDFFRQHSDRILVDQRRTPVRGPLRLIRRRFAYRYRVACGERLFQRGLELFSSSSFGNALICGAVLAMETSSLHTDQTAGSFAGFRRTRIASDLVVERDPRREGARMASDALSARSVDH